MGIFWTQNATRDLKQLPFVAQKRIAAKMRFFASQKNPLKFAKPLHGSYLGSFRFRIGDYRIIIDVNDKSIFVLKVAKRDQIYS
jgi:mRNA interferase RelE/StbE